MGIFLNYAIVLLLSRNYHIYIYIYRVCVCMYVGIYICIYMVAYSSWFQSLKDLSCISSPLASTEGGFRGEAMPILEDALVSPSTFCLQVVLRLPNKSLVFFFFNSSVVVSL